MTPPNTHRYCLICDKETTFEYDRGVGHSFCQECNNRVGVHLDNVVLKHFLKKIKEMDYGDSLNIQEEEINNLKKRVEYQRKEIVGLKENIKATKQLMEKKKK